MILGHILWKKSGVLFWILLPSPVFLILSQRLFYVNSWMIFSPISGSCASHFYLIHTFPFLKRVPLSCLFSKRLNWILMIQRTTVPSLTSLLFLKSLSVLCSHVCLNT